ncbi:unnamed protein product [Effrenium voratum]|nr:unnamed protein product [Effrenium voratum]
MQIASARRTGEEERCVSETQDPSEKETVSPLLASTQKLVRHVEKGHHLLDPLGTTNLPLDILQWQSGWHPAWTGLSQDLLLALLAMPGCEQMPSSHGFSWV